ncbi:hypothetical protein G9A89_022731 [Geosiphon pyriformis]|nr:hypothetical protein G9A89_022731 [Geosiphon pyriformis]
MEADKPKSEHKQFNLSKTELINTSNDIILDSKLPTLVVKILELLELKPNTSKLTPVRGGTGGMNTLSTAISKFKPKFKGAEAIEEEIRDEDTKGTNPTRLNFFKIPEIWSDRSSTECFKEAKQSYKPELSREIKTAKEIPLPEDKSVPKENEKTTCKEKPLTTWAQVLPSKETGQAIRVCFFLYILAK